MQGFQLGQDKLALLDCMEERQKVWNLGSGFGARHSVPDGLARSDETNPILCTLHQPQFAEKFADAREIAIPLDFASPRRRPYE
jgi:hypothetical protein